MLFAVPATEHVKERSVAIVGLDAHDVRFRQLVQIAVVFLTDIIKKSVFLRIVQGQVGIPSLRELVVDVDDHVVGVPSAGGHAFYLRHRHPLSSHATGFRIEAIEFNIPTLSFGDLCRNKAIRRAET